MFEKRNWKNLTDIVMKSTKMNSDEYSNKNQAERQSKLRVYIPLMKLVEKDENNVPAWCLNIDKDDSFGKTSLDKRAEVDAKVKDGTNSNVDKNEETVINVENCNHHVIEVDGGVNSNKQYGHKCLNDKLNDLECDVKEARNIELGSDNLMKGSKMMNSMVLTKCCIMNPAWLSNLSRRINRVALNAMSIENVRMKDCLDKDYDSDNPYL
ncbi:1072_t:CDS:2 [Dentiscutata erythropus]|uniref:1072_t:CDS:1 n=1 Tax=Dentiscutata erythropus TaxID=1348616 RepID=A0A9N8ZWE2_9GLOM|nr:1072_t:CDS:2 [Dentiscutata erythropus]